MRAALDALAAVARARRGGAVGPFAVLGPMAELGPDGPAEHEALGRLAVRLGIARASSPSGSRPGRSSDGAALEGSWDGESSWVPDVDAAIALLRAELRPRRRRAGQGVPRGEPGAGGPGDRRRCGSRPPTAAEDDGGSAA